MKLSESFYTQHIGVEFKNLSILWKLIDQDRTVIYNLINLRARRNLKKKTILDIRSRKDGLSKSKYVERYHKFFRTEEQVKKSLEELEVFVGDYLDKLSIGLSNEWFRDYARTVEKNEKKRFIEFMKNLLAANPNMSIESKRDMGIIYKEFTETNTSIPLATLRTWKSKWQKSRRK